MNDYLEYYLFGDVYFFINDAESTKCSKFSSGDREWNQPQSLVGKVTIPGLGLPGLRGSRGSQGSQAFRAPRAPGAPYVPQEPQRINCRWREEH